MHDPLAHSLRVREVFVELVRGHTYHRDVGVVGERCRNNEEALECSEVNHTHITNTVHISTLLHLDW